MLLTQQKMLDALSELDWIIIDEIHDLLSNERGSQLSLSLERLQINSKHHITRIGLSATVGNTVDAAKFLVGTKRKYEIIKDETIRKYDVEIKHVDGTISDVADFIVDYLVKLNLDSPVLLFTNTRGESEFLASILREKSPINVELHHGSLSQQVREETEENLKGGRSRLVVCTSSLEAWTGHRLSGTSHALRFPEAGLKIYAKNRKKQAQQGILCQRNHHNQQCGR
ncbi:helicase-related protein [Candidatus Nitrosotenuis chungbukensis]|nr:helicase-related protein [Candidatus Nitrosotenuis chungbukensis]